MRKVYVIPPVVGLLVFIAFYWNFAQGAALRAHEQELRDAEERKTRLIAQAEQKKKAVEDAIAAQQKRQAERDAAAKKKDAEDAARQALMDKRNQAFEDVNKRLRPQLDRLKTDAEDIKSDIAQLELQKKQYVDEETFLRTFVNKAQDNVKTYQDMLARIAAADKAHAEAEAAAAKAKKNS